MIINLAHASAVCFLVPSFSLDLNGENTCTCNIYEYPKHNIVCLKSLTSDFHLHAAYLCLEYRNIEVKVWDSGERCLLCVNVQHGMLTLGQGQCPD